VHFVKFHFGCTISEQDDNAESQNLHLKTSAHLGLWLLSHVTILWWNFDEIQDIGLWFVMLCYLVGECQHLSSMSCLHFQDQSDYIWDAFG
jgi:hypothetical protein